MGKIILNGKEYTGSGSEWHEYSTEEKVIGKWIDGKPIYEKTLELNSPSGNGTLADLSSYSIDTMINIRWLLYTSTGDIIYGSSSYYQVIQVYFTTSSSLIKMDYNNASWATSRPMKVIIQYTKTTD